MFFSFNENLRSAILSLKANKLRSVLTALGIVIGVTGIIVILTTIRTLNGFVEKSFSAIGANNFYIEKMPWVITDNFWRFRNRPSVTDKHFDFVVSQAKSIKYAAKCIDGNNTIKYGNKVISDILVSGTEQNDMHINNTYPEFGRFINDIDVERVRYVCVIGKGVANEFFPETDPLGRKIKIGNFDFKIIGVLPAIGQFFGQNLDNQIIIPVSTFFRSGFEGFRGGRNRRSLQLAFQAKDSKNFEEAKLEVEGLMRTARKLKPLQENNFAINEQSQLTEFFDKTVGTLSLVIILIAVMSLVVGGIGIANIMLVSVTERTKEIGIRKALGAKRRTILGQFLIEAIFISMVGGVIGFLIGSAIVYAANLIGNKTQPDIFGDVKIVYDFYTLIIAVGFSGLIGLVAGYFPAAKASKLIPIEALRFE